MPAAAGRGAGRFGGGMMWAVWMSEWGAIDRSSITQEAGACRGWGMGSVGWWSTTHSCWPARCAA